MADKDGISFVLDEVDLSKIQKKLGGLKDQAPDVLRRALNDTAKAAKKDLAKKAQETYVVKQGRFTKAMKQQNATKSNLTAIIKITGEQLELKDFKVSPAGFLTGKNRPDVVKAKVLRSSSLKPLQKGNIKAFVAKFKNKHTSVVQRRDKRRYPIEKLMSNSIPKMVGSEKNVYGIVEPNIQNNLKNNIDKEIRRILYWQG